MKPNAPSSDLQTAGAWLAGLVGYAVVASLIFLAAFAQSHTGNQRPWWVEQLAGGAGRFLGLSIVVSLAAAVLLFLSGLVRWPAQVIRSPRWVLSAIGIVLVAAAVLLVILVAAFIAVQHP